jgi:hypothetical protein
MNTPGAVQCLLCPNCAGSLAMQPFPRFCPGCGQAVALHRPPLDTARAALARYWRTGIALMLLPGRLTLEFAAGRRMAYVPPLRLYLAASFMFFLVVRSFGVSGAWQVQIVPGVDAHGQAITAAANPQAYRELVAEMRACVDRAHQCSWWRTQIARVQLKAVAQAGATDAVGQRMLSMTPNAVFVLLPVFAAIVMLVYRVRHVSYGAHLVFSLHIHAFAFLALLILSQLPLSLVVGGALISLAYAARALQVVYAGRWWVTLVRAATIMVLYAIALLISIQVLGIASILLV